MLLADLYGILPAWMTRAPREHWAKLMAGPAAMLDAMAEGVLQARFASMPGELDVPGGSGFDDATALPYTGRDRQIRSGLAESIFSWAAAQRRWRDSWAVGATPLGLLNQLQRILSPNPPTLHMVNAHGDWWTLFANGNILQFRQNGAGIDYHQADGFVAANAVVPNGWDWDSLADPHPFGFGDVTRFWIIIEAPCNLPYLAGISGHIGDGRTIGMGKGTGDAATIGTTAPIKQADLVRHLVLEWRAAGLRCSHVIVAFDTSQFGDIASANFPQGDYGWPCHDVAGNMVPARDPTARYWRAEPGGFAGS